MRDPVEKEVKKQTDILGDIMRTQKQVLKETREMHRTLLSILELLSRSSVFNSGVENEDQEPPDGP